MKKTSLLEAFKGKPLDENYFDNYGGRPYSENYRGFTIPAEVIVEDLVRNGINFKSILDVGCASGELVRDLRKLGMEAYGIDNNKYIMSKNLVPKYCTTMDLRDIDKFKKNIFDVAYVNSFMYLFPQEVPEVLNKFKKVFTKAVYMCCPYLEEPFFPDPYRKFLASSKWWDKQFEEAGFIKVCRDIYKI